MAPRDTVLTFLSAMEQSFQKFRPLCAVLVQNPQPEILEKLETLCSQCPAEELQSLQEYLLFPMQVYLKNPTRSENYTISVIAFVRRFFSRVGVHVSSLFLLKDLLGNILPIMSGLSSTQADLPAQAVSEDLRIASLECIRALIKIPHQEEHILEGLYSEDMKLPLSHLVFLSLEWAQPREHSRRLIMASLELLEMLPPTSNAIETQVSFSKVFQTMLPGLSTGLMKILKSSDFCQGYKVKSLALRTWRKFVTGVLADYIIEQRPEMSAEWLNKAKDHILMQMQLLNSLARSLLEYSSVPLRQELFATVSDMIKKSSDTLSNLIYSEIALLSCLSVNVEDQSNGVSKQSEELLGKVLEETVSIDKVKVAQGCQEVIFETSLELERKPGLFESFELGRKLVTLESQFILLRFVEKQSTLFISETYMGQLLNALLTVTQLETTPHITEFIFEEDSNLNHLFQPELLQNTTRPRKNYVYLRNDELKARFGSILSQLVRYANLGDLIQLALNVVSGSSVELALSTQKREAVSLINQLLTVLLANHESSFLEPSLDEMVQIFELILTSFLRLDLDYSEEPTGNWTLARHSTGGGSSREPQDPAKMDWPFRCLVVEAIGTLALIADVSNWTNFKHDYLGQILTRVLSTCEANRSHESHVLFFAIKDLAKGCDFEDIRGLLLANVDYLGRELALLLRQMHLRDPANGPPGGKDRRPALVGGVRGIPTLLKVVLRLKNTDDYPGLRDTLQSLLDQLDISWLHSDKAVSARILRIILLFVQSFQDHQDDHLGEDQSDFKQHSLEPKAMTRFIQDLQRLHDWEKHDPSGKDGPGSVSSPPQGFHDMKLSEENVQVTEENEETTSNEGEEEAQKIVSERTQLIKEIIDHTRHFISMVKRPEWQILALEIVCLSTELIRHEKDELLPLMHLSWQSLQLLFSSENIFVVDQAFKVLRTFARVAGDFIQKRTLKDAFPAILKYVKRLQVMIQDRNKHQTLIARQSRRLLQSLMEGLWDFMALLDLNEKEVDLIIEEMLDFVQFAREQKLCHEAQIETYFQPKRLMDHDTLVMKLKFMEKRQPRAH